FVVAGSEDGVFETGVFGGGEPLFGAIVLRVESGGVFPVLARRGGVLPALCLDCLLNFFGSETGLAEVSTGDHWAGGFILSLYSGNAPMDEEAESGGGEPLRVGVGGAGEGGRLRGVVDAQGGVLVGHGAGLFLLLGGGCRGGGEEQGSAGHCPDYSGKY